MHIQTLPLSQAYQPVLEVRRGPIVESIHFGAIAVVSPDGALTHSLGDPYLVTFLRSASKPFQLLPFVEMGGPEYFGLTEQELAILCASHDGTDEHVAVLEGIQKKVGIGETDLLCGIHPPYHFPTQRELWLQGKKPGPNRHNCSGKHTAMLALAKMLNAPKDTYLQINHSVQQLILKAFSEMVSVPIPDIIIGTDGCSAPVFAIPLYNAALGFARLADPCHLPEARRRACQRITQAMIHYPDMVAGPGTFDTVLMEVMQGSVFTKAGAEGFQGTGILAGTAKAACHPLGIALKIADGDISGNFRQGTESAEGRARPIVTIEILAQLEALSDRQRTQLAAFDQRAIYNHRHLEVGTYRTPFTLKPAQSQLVAVPLPDAHS